MELAHRRVSRHFRDLIARELPDLNRNPAYWRLLEHLLFGTWCDNETGELLLSQELLAAIEGKERLLSQRHYVAQNFLQEFSNDVFRITWSGWSYREGRCRRLLSEAIPSAVRDALEKELRCITTDDIFFFDGKPWTLASQRAQRKATYDRVSMSANNTCCPEEATILRYLNALPPNGFTKILRHLPEAEQRARAVAQGQEQQFRVLRVIRDQPKPIYGSASRTVRLFGQNESLLQLRSDIRRILTQDWAEFDLRSAQLAVAARMWPIPEIQIFLEKGGNIWKELSIHFSLKESSDIKRDLFKTGLYSLIFGMSRANLKARLDEAGARHNLTEAAARFMQHPLIQAAYKAREQAFKRIKADHGGETIFGNKLSLDDFNAPSILAQQTQAVELALLYPVIELAMTTDEFKVMLWQHDGFCVAFTRREELWTQRIESVVAHKARELGIATRLEKAA